MPPSRARSRSRRRRRLIVLVGVFLTVVGGLSARATAVVREPSAASTPSAVFDAATLPPLPLQPLPATPFDAPTPLTSGSEGTWSWPLSPRPSVERGFEPPDGPWSAGHRGVDLLGQVGDQVLAVDAGTVTYAGVLAGRGVVVVDHGTKRSTYEPVTPLVRTGALVRGGEVLGLLQAVQSHCLPQTCLHLGARDDVGYVDPLGLLGDLRIVLKPTTG